MTSTTRARTSAPVRVAVFVLILVAVFAAAFAAGRIVGGGDSASVDVPATDAPAHVGGGDGH